MPVNAMCFILEAVLQKSDDDCLYLVLMMYKS